MLKIMERIVLDVGIDDENIWVLPFKVMHSQLLERLKCESK
jgi:hypothetical protein